MRKKSTKKFTVEEILQQQLCVCGSTVKETVDQAINLAMPEGCLDTHLIRTFLSCRIMVKMVLSAYAMRGDEDRAGKMVERADFIAGKLFEDVDPYIEDRVRMLINFDNLITTRDESIRLH